MTAVGDSFVANGGSNTIQINSGGELKASGSTFTINQVSLNAGSVLANTDLMGDTFNTTLFVPFGGVQYLSDNTAFNDIDVTGGPLSSGALNLDQLGTGSALRYVFPSGFTVATGATLNVGTNVAVLIGADQTITDGGSLNFGAGDTVIFNGAATVDINSGGTMTAVGDLLCRPTAQLTSDPGQLRRHPGRR